jgi:hypothetical protein
MVPVITVTTTIIRIVRIIRRIRMAGARDERRINFDVGEDEARSSGCRVRLRRK